jgi:5S rRNA maturation endonuclease (ribonuclease M5)
MSSIKDRELISELKEIGVRIVDLKKRNVPGFCPNPEHADSHPSFFFDLDTQLFQCFGCSLKGKGIDKLRFQVTGILVKSGKTIEPNFIKNTQKKTHTPSIPSAPIAIGNDGEKYLIKRGFTLDTIKKWGILYSSVEESVIIPLEKMGYVSRFFYPEKHENKKYKYVFGTDIDCDLFGASQYVENGFKYAILVEGSLDAIWLHQLGFTTSLAILHPDVSPQQIKTLKGLTSIVYILLDNDKGGLETEEKIIKKLRRDSFIVKRCRLPEGKDPNDCTKEQVETALKDAKF